jgi:hypothetical protein
LFLGFGVYLGVLPPNSLKRPRDKSSKGIKDSNLSSSKGEVEDIEAKIQRRVKRELEAEVKRRSRKRFFELTTYVYRKWSGRKQNG